MKSFISKDRRSGKKFPSKKVIYFQAGCGREFGQKHVRRIVLEAAWLINNLG
jgi:hypothetical protein